MKLDAKLAHTLTQEQKNTLEQSRVALDIMRQTFTARREELRRASEAESLLDEPNYTERKTFYMGRINELNRVLEILPKF